MEVAGKGDPNCFLMGKKVIERCVITFITP